MSKVKTGITLFSLGTPYLKGELDLEGVIRTAAELGAEGYEIVATQMIPSYPFVSWNYCCISGIWSGAGRFHVYRFCKGNFPGN